MSYHVETPSAARESFWSRVWRFMKTWDEAVSRTEADDLIDRIAALEKRMDALSAPSAAPEGSAIKPLSE